MAVGLAHSQYGETSYATSQAPLIATSSSQTHDARRSSVYQSNYGMARPSIAANSAGRVPFPASAQKRYSSINDLALSGPPQSYPSTPGGGVYNRPNNQSVQQRPSSAGVMATSSGPPNHAPLLGAPPVYKDPRPRDKKTVGSWQTDVYEFLLERGYQEPLTTRTLQTPTTKDFQNIFKFIVTCSDPGHRWQTAGKKFEDEVLPLLKQMGYMAVDTISKSGLQAPGSMHTWPTMLAMLHWMVMSIKVRTYNGSFDVLLLYLCRSDHDI